MQFIGNRFENFINGNGIWIIIGCLCAAFIISIVFLFLNISRAKKIISSQEQSLKDSDSNSKDISIKTESKTTVEADQSRPESENKPAKKTSSYTITHDEKTKEWVVKRIGASRATRRCATKEEAESLVKRLTDK